MRDLVILGVAFLGVAAVLAVADSEGMSRRMPTQVPPRWVAMIPLGAVRATGCLPRTGVRL